MEAKNDNGTKKAHFKNEADLFPFQLQWNQENNNNQNHNNYNDEKKCAF